MSHIEWSDKFKTGINVIDGQHKRIIHYINQLTDAQRLNEPALVGEVLDDLTDYTLSHFAFEESLMDEAHYDAAAIHKQTHDAFRDKINNYQQRYANGELVEKDLFELLNMWLLDHIAEDDNSYVPFVKKSFSDINMEEKQGWIKQKVKEFFK